MRGKQTQLGRRSLRLLTYTIAGLAVTVAGSSVPPPDTATLWASGPGGALAVDASTGEVYFDIPTSDPVRAVAVDRANSRVWLQAGADEVAAYDGSGQKLFGVRTPRPLRADRQLEVDPVSGDVWLADRSRIYRIEIGAGIVLRHEQPSSERITGTALDPVRSRFWYATRDGLTALGSDGTVLQRIPAAERGRPHGPRLAYDGELDRLWVAGNRRLARYDADGNRTFVTPLSMSVSSLAPDGRGGLWLASDNELRHIDRSGLIEFSLRDRSLQALAVNVDDGSVWVTGRLRLRHYGLDGELRHDIEARAPDGSPRPVFDIALPRRIPIEITIESPENGALIADNMPPIDIRVEGAAELEPSDLSLHANGGELAAACEQLDTGLYRCAPATPLPEGGNEVLARVQSGAGMHFDSEPVAFTVDSVPPDIEIAHPPQGFVTNNPELTVTGGLDEPAGLTLNGETVALDASLGFSLPLTLAEGENSLAFRATDAAGNVNAATRHPLLDTEPPAVPQSGLIDGGEAVDGRTTVSGEPGSVEPHAEVEITNTRTGTRVTVQANDKGAFTAEIDAEPGDEFAIVARDAAGNESETGSTTARGPDIPPDPEDIAPPVADSSALTDRVAFLYQGDDPIQQGVAPDAIEERRTAVLRGEVRDRAGDPLPGVRIDILDRPELGWTHTQLDGGFDMAVNGGGALTVVYEKDGYLPVQRTVETEWGDWYHADDVVMIPLDDKVTTVDLTDTEQPFQVAQGSVVEDSDGERRATLLFPAGTTAEITLADGSKRQLSQLDVRATEYTVGSSGPDAMPAQLPPSSAYTYAVELSVDQALEQGVKVAGKDVVFDRPVPFYVDNFLDFPAGEAVPTGYYDNDKAAWIPYDNGRVIEILDESGGLAVLDVTGGGAPASAAQLDGLGIADAERARLAELYDPGDSLWRVTLTHLSTWDCNWPYGPPEDAKAPTVPQPETLDGNQPKNSDEENDCPGCSISPQQQSVGESIAIAGTPFSLHYQSKRAEGYVQNVVDIPLTGDQIPGSLESVELDIEIAGQHIAKTFTPATNLSHRFSWDGLDGYGRKIIGAAEANVALKYRYPCEYRPGDNGFGEFGDSAQAIGSRNDCEGFVFSRTSNVVLNSPLEQATPAVANWSLSIEHAWDDKHNVLLRGDALQRSIPSNIIRTFAGTGASLSRGDGGPATEATFTFPQGVAVGPDGNLYILDGSRLRVVTRDGIIDTVATGNRLTGIAISADGSVYVSDGGDRIVFRIAPDGSRHRVAGTGIAGPLGDGGPAVDARLDNPSGIAIADDGTLYITETGFTGARNPRVRHVTPDGIINTVVGTGTVGFSGDGGPATKAQLNSPTDVTIAADGSLYIADSGNSRIRRVTPDGIIETVAGTGLRDFSGDAAPATEANLSVSSLAIGADGSLYFGDWFNRRVRRVTPDGIVETVAGTGLRDSFGDGGLAIEAGLSPSGIAIGADKSMYIADAANRRVRRIAPNRQAVARGDLAVPSKNGTRLFVFDAAARHLRTEDVLTGETLLSFDRDAEGRLLSVTDGDSNVTTIERDDSGRPASITAPHGQRTTLAVDGNGHLSQIADPTGAVWSMNYTTDGLLTGITQPNGQVNTFTYDENGLLIQDIDPNGGGWQLSRTDLADGYRVDLTSGEGRVRKFTFERFRNGLRTYTDEAPDDTQTQRSYTSSQDTTIASPDGTVLFTSEDPDPRFKMAAPLTEEKRITLPSGLELLQKKDRDVSLANPEDSLSLQILTDTVTTNGHVTTTTYNGDTRQWSFTSPENRVTTMTVDGLGRPLTRSVTGLEPVSTAYDSRGRPAALSQGAGDEERTTSFDYYDASAGGQAGYLRSLTDAAGRETAFAYDAAGRVTEQTLPDGRTIGYQYDANGNLIAITPPGRSAHLFEYDGLDQRTVYEPPELTGIESVTRYRYNLDRQPTSIERPGGESVTFAYDAGGRLASRSMNAGTTSYTYDVTTGQIDTIATTGGIDLSLAWDGFLPVQAVWSGQIDGSVARTYDNNLWLVAEAVNGNNIGFAYDDDGLLTRAGDMTLTRASDHGMVTATALAAITGSRVYNGFGELSARDVTLDGENIYDVSYERDKLGRIIAKTETLDGTVRSWSYLYDQAGRLTQVTLDGTAAYSYSYDANGNRIGYTGPDGNITGNYDVQDRIQSYGAVTYTHSPAGERETKTTSEGTTNYDYDAAGNLRRVEQPDGTVIEYLIDGRDRRVGKKVDGQLVKGWLYRDRLNPVAELDGDGNVEARFIYGDKPNVPAYMIKDDKTYRIVSDHLGSVRLVIDTETKEIAQRIDYSPFGRITVDTNPGFQPFTFAGGLHDPDTDLIRFGARDYDPTTGRWTAKDPIDFAGGDTNLYGYVVNDPINFTDSRGTFAMFGATAGAIIGGVSSYVGTRATGGSVWEGVRSGFVGAGTGAIAGFLPGSTLLRGTLSGASLGAFSSTASQSASILGDRCKSFAKDFNLSAVAGSAIGGAYTGGLHFQAPRGLTGKFATALRNFGINSATGGVGSAVGEQ